MSKIYKALEKAERERERELKKERTLIPETRDEKMEEHKRRPGPARSYGRVSDHRLVSLFQSGSLAAEQFRKLRTQLLRLNILGSRKTIMVTSAASNEGKTLVAANLAAGIAYNLHNHALLVDCDLRNPSIAKWFGFRDGFGLSEYLVRNVEVSEIIRKTEIEKLSVLPGGSVQENPTELIGSKKMEALVNELKSRYDDRYIILDATPLLATTEPEVLSKVVDGIIIVVRAGVTPRETVKQAIASLEKEKILGFVLNDLQFKSSCLSSRYFGSDGYYYRYGYGKTEAEPNRWTKLIRFNRKHE
jgi:exopolysaccharide/PEP-CTERM locus tyrosine autokinase